MSDQTSFVGEGIDRVQGAFQSVGDEFERLQGELDGRRKDFEAETQKRVKKLQKDLRKQPFFKRAENFRRDATKQIEQGVEGLLSALQIASSTDMKKLDRKLNAINKRLKEIETRAKTSVRGAQSH
jgi:type I restriction-modification system DNA methylase subunit